MYDIASLKSYIAVQEADKTAVQYHTRQVELKDQYNPPHHNELRPDTELQHNAVYDLSRSVTTAENWTVEDGATAEIYIDCTTTAYNVNWPNSWIWGDSGVFKVSESTLYKPALALGTVTCVVVRKHGNDVIAHVEYIIDKN